MAVTVAQLFSKSPIFRNSREGLKWKKITLPLPSPIYNPPITSLLLRSAPPIHHYHFLSHPPLLPSLLLLRFSTTMSDSDSGQQKTVRVEIKGVVQGVFFRNWTVENATQLGLNGWVRNRRDGSVEALFSGSSDKVDEMQQRCRGGPPSAIVTSLQSFPSNDDPGSGFRRTPTV